MKKVFTMALGLMLVAGATTSCKKGENDPGLSLTSRKARVAGEWTVTSSQSTSTYTDGASSTTTSTESMYDGVSEITTTSSGGVSTKDTTNYTITLTMGKDGSYTQVYTETGDDWSSTYTSTGHWAFVGKSKSAELKNKEAIILSETSGTSSATFGGVTFTSSSTMSAFQDGDIMVIDQLKSKEMIVKMDRDWTDNDGTNTDTYTSTGTMTLTHN